MYSDVVVEEYIVGHVAVLNALKVYAGVEVCGFGHCEAGYVYVGGYDVENVVCRVCCFHRCY